MVRLCSGTSPPFQTINGKIAARPPQYTTEQASATAGGTLIKSVKGGNTVKGVAKQLAQAAATVGKTKHLK